MTSKLHTGCSSYNMYKLQTNADNSTQFGAALCRLILLPNVASLVSCTFCNVMKHRQEVGICMLNVVNDSKKNELEENHVNRIILNLNLTNNSRQ